MCYCVGLYFNSVVICKRLFFVGLYLYFGVVCFELLWVCCDYCVGFVNYGVAWVWVLLYYVLFAMGRCCVGCGCVFTSFRLDYVGVWLVWVVCVSVWFAPSGLGWAVGCLVLVLLFVGTFCLVLVLWFGLGG